MPRRGPSARRRPSPPFTSTSASAERSAEASAQATGSGHRRYVHLVVAAPLVAGGDGPAHTLVRLVPDEVQPFAHPGQVAARRFRRAIPRIQDLEISDWQTCEISKSDITKSKIIRSPPPGSRPVPRYPVPRKRGHPIVVVLPGVDQELLLTDLPQGLADRSGFDELGTSAND